MCCAVTTVQVEEGGDCCGSNIEYSNGGSDTLVVAPIDIHILASIYTQALY